MQLNVHIANYWSDDAGRFGRFSHQLQIWKSEKGNCTSTSSVKTLIPDFWLKGKHPWVLAWDNINKILAFPSPGVICTNYFLCYLYTVVLFGHCNIVVLYLCRSLLKTSLYIADVTFLSKEYFLIWIWKSTIMHLVTFAEVVYTIFELQPLGQKHGTTQDIMWSNSTSLNFSECVAGHIRLSSAV